MRTLLFVLATLFIPLTALAQVVPQSSLTKCASIADASERLHCFDELTQQNGDVSDQQPIEPIPIEPINVTDSEPSTSSTSVEEFGAEQLKSRSDQSRDAEETRITAIVTHVSKGVRGNLYFHLENGQVWRQIEARYVPYPRNQRFNIELTQGMMGDYRVRVEGNGRMIRVRRVE